MAILAPQLKEIERVNTKIASPRKSLKREGDGGDEKAGGRQHTLKSMKIRLAHTNGH